MGIVWYEHLIITGKAKKLCTSVTVLGTGHSLIAVTFFGSVSIPYLDTMCPRYVIQDLKKNLHLLGLSHNPAVDNFSNIPSVFGYALLVF